jgi:hypothetical protein
MGHVPCLQAQALPSARVRLAQRPMQVRMRVQVQAGRSASGYASSSRQRHSSCGLHRTAAAAAAGRPSAAGARTAAEVLASALHLPTLSQHEPLAALIVRIAISSISSLSPSSM